jgi:hypothetical protein
MYVWVDYFRKVPAILRNDLQCVTLHCTVDDLGSFLVSGEDCFRRRRVQTRSWLKVRLSSWVKAVRT